MGIVYILYKHLRYLGKTGLVYQHTTNIKKALLVWVKCSYLWGQLHQLLNSSQLLRIQGEHMTFRWEGRPNLVRLPNLDTPFKCPDSKLEKCQARTGYELTGNQPKQCLLTKNSTKLHFHTTETNSPLANSRKHGTYTDFSWDKANLGFGTDFRSHDCKSQAKRHAPV